MLMKKVLDRSRILTIDQRCDKGLEVLEHNLKTVKTECYNAAEMNKDLKRKI